MVEKACSEVIWKPKTGQIGLDAVFVASVLSVVQVIPGFAW